MANFQQAAHSKNKSSQVNVHKQDQIQEMGILSQESQSQQSFPLIPINESKKLSTSTLNLNGKRIHPDYSEGGFEPEKSIKEIPVTKRVVPMPGSMNLSQSKPLNQNKTAFVQFTKNNGVTIMPLPNVTANQSQVNLLAQQMRSSQVSSTAYIHFSPNKKSSEKMSQRSSTSQVYYAGIEKASEPKKRQNHVHLKNFLNSHRQVVVLDPRGSASEREFSTIEKNRSNHDLFQSDVQQSNRSMSQVGSQDDLTNRDEKNGPNQSVKVAQALKEIKKTRDRQQDLSVPNQERTNYQKYLDIPMMQKKANQQKATRLLQTDLKEHVDLVQRQKVEVTESANSVMDIIHKRKEPNNLATRLTKDRSNQKLPHTQMSPKNLNSDLQNLQDLDFSQQNLTNNHSTDYEEDDFDQIRQMQGKNNSQSQLSIKISKDDTSPSIGFHYVGVVKKSQSRQLPLAQNAINLPAASAHYAKRSRNPDEINKQMFSHSNAEQSDHELKLKPKLEPIPQSYTQKQSYQVQPFAEKQSKDFDPMTINALPQTHRTLKQHPPWQVVDPRRPQISKLKQDQISKRLSTERNHKTNQAYSIEQHHRVYDHILRRAIGKQVLDRDSISKSQKLLEQTEIFKRLNQDYWQNITTSAKRDRDTYKRDIGIKIHSNKVKRRNKQLTSLSKAQKAFESFDRLQQQSNMRSSQQGLKQERNSQKILPKIRDTHGMIISNLEPNPLTRPLPPTFDRLNRFIDANRSQQ